MSFHEPGCMVLLRPVSAPMAGRGLRKTATGISGLDEVTGGGLPLGRSTLVCGPAGCGKTLLDYLLTLFVTGASDMSVRAISNVRALCEAHLPGRYQLEVIDVHRDAALMSSYDVVAAPTLVKEAPLPKRMLVGDLSDTARVLAALDISPPALASAAKPE